MGNSKDSKDRRAFGREPALLPAVVMKAGPGSRSLPCVVTDISSRGARLRLSPLTPLPDRFVLAMGPRGERAQTAISVWRRGEEIGVRFRRSVGERIASLFTEQSLIY